MSSMKPKYWRSLSELEGDSEFQEFVEREFREPLEQKPLNSKGRRRFVQLMGASFALAGCRWKKEKILPHSRRPDGAIPGVPVHYASVMDISGAATSLLIKSFDGRPIKIEGNSEDTDSLGGTGAQHQAAILSLYDPDRSNVPLHAGKPSVWQNFDKALKAAARQGSTFAVLSEATSSPSMTRLRGELLKKAPGARWVSYEPIDSSAVAQASQLAFGQDVTTVIAAEKADYIVALESDLTSPVVPGGIGVHRGIANRRDADSGQMSRIYAFESYLSDLGGLGDHRVSVKPSQIPAIVAYMDAKISAHEKASGAQKAPELHGETLQVLDVAISDLLAHKGKSLVTAGTSQSPEVLALVHRINSMLGNIGQTVSYVKRPTVIDANASEFAALTADMQSGKVSGLLILGANPVYTAPVDLNFKAALSKVKQSFHVGLYEDETAKLCSYHGPQAHFLEAWGDARAIDGSTRIAQPLIAPLAGERSQLAIIASLLDTPDLDEQAIVRKTAGITDEKAWRKAVHDGFTADAAPAAQVSVKNFGQMKLPETNGLEVTFSADPALYDGRYANNGWLQELPHPVTKLAWGNGAFVSPRTAKENNLKDGFLATVSLGGRSLELPLIIAPGQADGSIGLFLGYGRSAAGMVGGLAGDEDAEIVGEDTYTLRTSKALSYAPGASIKHSGARQELAITQDLWAMDEVGKTGIKQREDELLRETSVTDYDDFKKQAHHGGEHDGPAHPGDIKHKVHHPPLLNLWNAPVSYDGHKWGLAVDLNKCSGCGTCMVACQSENNIPVVGKGEVAMGREMSWLRVERYYKGDADTPEIRNQPVMCQQCENAPCEQVCPVGATVHSREGLNDMVYNRCIGTRYCSNNCPYKVRRFNYRNYNLETYGTTPYTGTTDPRAKRKAMAFNPEVTVRSRGVMEKCTFCVQRIQNAKIIAKNNKRPLKDGDIKTACGEACPAGAMVFGDLNDKTSKVVAKQNVPRAYELLQELNNRPRVNYLARISNPHPELSTQDGHSSEHH